MELKPSPYSSVGVLLWDKEILGGNQFNSNNPLHWGMMEQCLTSSWDYPLEVVWVRKVSLLAHSIVNVLFTYYSNI
eukprot:9565447-Ditylum_brightwellii.AAC.1